MRLSIDISPEWNKQLKKAAFDAGAQSVADFVRMLIGDAIGDQPVRKSWGRQKVTEDTGLTEVKKDTEVKSSTTPEPAAPVVIEPPKPKSESPKVDAPKAKSTNNGNNPELEAWLKRAKHREEFDKAHPAVKPLKP